MSERRSFWPLLVFSSSGAREAGASRSDSGEYADQFRRLMLPPMDAAYNYARFLTRDPHRAEDVLQDAFLRASRSFHTWRGGAARAWLFTIVRNCFLSTMSERADQVDEVELIQLVDPEELVEARDEPAFLRQTIADLRQ